MSGIYDNYNISLRDAKIENVKYIKDSGNGDKFLSDNGKHYSIDNNMILSTHYMYDKEWIVTGNYERLQDTSTSNPYNVSHFFRLNNNTVKMIPNANNKPKILNTTRLTNQIKVNFLMKSQEYSYIVGTLGLDHAIFKIKLINAKNKSIVYSDTIYPEDFKAWDGEKWVNIFDGNWHQMSALLYMSGLEGYENDLYLEFEPIITDTNYTIDIADIQVTPINMNEASIQSGGNISEMLERTYRYADETIANTINDEINQSNWTETDTTKFSYIKNKPNLSTVSTSGNYNDLSNKPSYVVETVDEMNALVNVKEGDTCVVTKYEVKKLLNVGDNLKDKTIYFDNLNELTRTSSYYFTGFMTAKNLDSEQYTKEELTIMGHTAVYKRGIYYKDTKYYYTESDQINPYNTETLNDVTLSDYSSGTFVPDDYSLSVTKNFEITSVLDSDEFYTHMYIKNYEKHTFIYDNNTWIDTTIYSSLINGNIKKGNEEIVVFRPNRLNSKEFNIDDTNHIIYVTLDTYDKTIPLQMYSENSIYKFYEVKIDDNVEKNISDSYNFKFQLIGGTSNKNTNSDYIELIFNGYTEQIPTSWFDNSWDNFFYIDKLGHLFKYISKDEYTNIPIGLKRLEVKCSSSYLTVELNNNYVQEQTLYGKALIVYKEDLHSIEKQSGNLTYPYYTNGLYILYISNNSSVLSEDLKSWLDYLGCTKYKTVTTLKSYLMISYCGNAIEYVDGTNNITKTVSYMIDKETKTLMPIQFIDNDSTSLSTGTITLDNKLKTPRINILNSSDVYEGALWNSTYNRTVHDGLHLTHEPSKYLILGYKDETDGIYYSYMIMDKYRVLDDGDVNWCPIRFEKEALFRYGLKIGTFSDIQIGGYNLKEKISSLESAITTGTGMVQWNNVLSKPTTISGYGITDAYTKTNVDNLLTGYIPKTGGVLTGALQILSSGLDGQYNGLLVGNDCYIGDCNYTDTIGIMGTTNSNIGYIKFGKLGGHLGFDGSKLVYNGAAVSLYGHTHDDRYYTESEINTKLASYSLITHTHLYDETLAFVTTPSGTTGASWGYDVPSYSTANINKGSCMSVLNSKLTFTAPTVGVYQLQGTITISASGVVLYYYVDGVLTGQLYRSSGNTEVASFNTTIKLNASQKITFFFGSGVSSNVTLNQLVIKRLNY